MDEEQRLHKVKDIKDAQLQHNSLCFEPKSQSDGAVKASVIFV